MKCYSGWSYRPYQPLTEQIGQNTLQICRLAPSAHKIAYEFLDQKPCPPYTLKVNPIGSETGILIENADFCGEIENLEDLSEYEISVIASDGRKSHVRRFRTGDIPGTVVNYLHPEDHQYDFSGDYLCSPCIVRLPSGALLCSMDLFGHATPQNLEVLFRSDDNGVTWHYVTDIMPCFWGRLFIHRGVLYMLGISNEYGDILIGRSDDEGVTWGTPTVLLRGSACTRERGNHRAPMAVYELNGRLWTGIEYGAWGKKRFSVGLLSADADADLLNVDSWHVTDYAEIDFNEPGLPGEFRGVIEGNVAIRPDGSLWELMRCCQNTALLFRYDPKDPDKAGEFVQVVDFPMAHSKFEVHIGPDGLFYAIGNYQSGRNVLSLMKSPDLIHWELVRHIENHAEMDAQFTAFQYPTWFFEGNEIYLVSRTAWNGASNFHDANLTTFYHFTL